MLKAKQQIAVQSEFESRGEAVLTIKVFDKGVNHSFFISEIQKHRLSLQYIQCHKNMNGSLRCLHLLLIDATDFEML